MQANMCLLRRTHPLSLCKLSCPLVVYRRDMADKYNIKYFYDIKDRGDFKANPDYKGVCHIALAQVRHERGCEPYAG